MSNEYKDWINDLKNAPIGSPDHKRWLLIEYPWLNIDEDEAINYIDMDENEVYTYIDCAPNGWAKLCEDLCAELKVLFDRVGYKDYELCQVKEKFGGLRWYDNGVPQEIYEEYSKIIHKYENRSFHTCCKCGEPATKLSLGWICPFCDKCADEEWIGGFTKIDDDE